MATWTVRTINRDDGSTVDTLTNVRPGPFTYKRGFEPGTCELLANLYDPDVSSASLGAPDTSANGWFAIEVEILRDGVVWWRGSPCPATFDLANQAVKILCKTPEWYFYRRFFGWAERSNLLENGDLEDYTANVPDNWSVVGDVTTNDVTAIADGSLACELTSASGWGYIEQTEATALDNIEYSPGLPVGLTAWGKITSGATFSSGQWLAEIELDGAPGTFHEYATVTPTIQADGLFRAEVTMLVACDVDWTAKVRLYAVDGVITWDKAQLVQNDATTVAYNGGVGEDLAVLVENVTEYSQTSPWSDLQIAHDATTSGVDVLRGWEHSKHELIADAYRQLIKEYGCDIWVGSFTKTSGVITGVDRDLHFRMKRGATRSDLAITIDAWDTDHYDPRLIEGVLAGHVMTVDPSQASNVVIVSGESSTFALDEAGAFDSDAFSIADPLTLGTWIKAPSSVPVIGLDKWADQRLALEGVPPCLLTARWPLPRTVADAATTNADPTLTSATARFTSADVGKPVAGAGIPAGTTIATFTSATSVEMSANATATASNVTIHIGVLPPMPGDVIPVYIDAGACFFDDDMRVQSVTIDPDTETATATLDRDDGVTPTDEEA